MKFSLLEPLVVFLPQQIQLISAQDFFNLDCNQLYVYGNAHHPAAIVDGKFVSPELSYLVTHLSPMQEDQLLQKPNYPRIMF